LDDKLQFKVIEFNKEAKRIILSHSRIFEDAQKSAANEQAPEKKAKKSTKKEEMPAMEKTTLGDIEGLAALKDELTKSEAKTAEKKASKKAKSESAE